MGWEPERATGENGIGPSSGVSREMNGEMIKL